jgi:hypothetical protein
MPEGLGNGGGAEGPVLYGDALPDNATVSRSLFPACLHTCKHSPHYTKKNQQKTWQHGKPKSRLAAAVVAINQAS